MIGELSKGLNQNSAMVKGVPTATPSRAFGLWLALLLLYFLLLPSAAETPDPGTGISASASQKMSQTLSLAPRYRHDTSAPRR